MTDKIRNLLEKQKQEKFAKNSGSEMHLKMQHIIIDKNIEKGDHDIIKKIKSKPGLLAFFSKNSRAETPIAGILNGRFISRRIDRMIVSDAEQKVMFMDYKTDINKNLFYEHYISQIKEYAYLLKKIYPNYSIHGFILWTHDFSLEKIC